MSAVIRQATFDDLDKIAPLFDAYRQFYRQPADIDRARDFLRERFAHHESVIFVALDEKALRSASPSCIRYFLPSARCAPIC